MIKRIVGVITGILLLCLLFYPFLSWYVMKEKPLSVAVLDKTVPKNDYREHLGLFWMLNHTKVRKDDGKTYELETDYYGYNPETYKGDEKYEMPTEVDLLYVADTYGVYQADLQENLTGERSQLLYGGLTIYEWNRVMSKKTKENTLIVEFNSLASPTASHTRRIAERNLGISWTGWIGRYFPELEDIEVPIWLKENWEEQTGKEWDLTGEGIAFVDDSDQVIVIQAEDFEGKVYFSWNEIGLSQYPNVANVNYNYWFDIIVPSDKVVVEANYELQLSERAEEVLRKHEIPLSFPAILHNPDEKIYYFAGDYADVGTGYYSNWYMPGWYYRVNAFFNPKDAFFWKVYVPLMKAILTEQASKGE